MLSRKKLGILGIVGIIGPGIAIYMCGKLPNKDGSNNQSSDKNSSTEALLVVDGFEKVHPDIVFQRGLAGTKNLKIQNKSQNTSAQNIHVNLGILKTQIDINYSPECHGLKFGETCTLTFMTRAVDNSENQIPIEIVGDNTNKIAAYVSYVDASISVKPSTTLVLVSDKRGGKSKEITITNNSESSGAIVSDVIVDLKDAETKIKIIKNSCTVPLQKNESCKIVFQGTGRLNSSDIEIYGNSKNTNIIEINSTVLDYGTEYQGGYVFDVKETASGFEGKIVAKDNSSEGIIWGCSETGCNTNTINLYTGQENTKAIVAFEKSKGLADNTYAASICENYSVDSYNDWYLPAICEMGPLKLQGLCEPGTPNIMNMLDQPDSPISRPAGKFWSSSERKYLNPYVLVQEFGDNPDSQIDWLKNSIFKVRCIRKITSE